jgi:LytS/YehU family sensor histidine kinase
MNSIKSLIQLNDSARAIEYLTTFSRLLRMILQNSDQKEISLYDELENCRLYAQLESMRFGDKLHCSFQIGEAIDLKSIKVPALIVQPFIENAIWHGIVPKDARGDMSVRVEQNGHATSVFIDDNGIGREMSRQYKFREAGAQHESKGMKLTQRRLDVDNLLRERQASLETIDKIDADGHAAGTTVILTFKEY